MTCRAAGTLSFRDYQSTGLRGCCPTSSLQFASLRHPLLGKGGDVAFLQLTQSLNDRGFQFEPAVRQQTLAPVAMGLPPLCGWYCARLSATSAGKNLNHRFVGLLLRETPACDRQCRERKSDQHGGIQTDAEIMHGRCRKNGVFEEI